ncbi:MAG: hypothetical protein ABF780_04185 [Bifidobacterium aquikefiri]|uniref:Multidrug ABC transporter permease n=1 Tax=Bifidobacterium aquikefiri TaxID=1653207 RepID=A0A261G6X3_9BIFI|nr:hypothetical protein [Bifidobacterium aquikefiri]OZG67158.1 multidrug ABC transporter permease [Bifidobacterium aquikefiri]
MTTPASTETSPTTEQAASRHVARGRGTVNASRQFISAPLLWHEIKRLWALSLLGIAVLLISGPIVVLLTPEAGNAQPSILRITIQDGNPGFLAYQILSPMVYALALFTYLNSSGRVSIMHSMPLTRGTIFRTNIVCGVILLYVPHIVATFSLLPFMRFFFKGFMNSGQLNLDGQGVNNASMLLAPNDADLLRWFIITSIIMLFIFATSVLGSMLTGNLGIGILMIAFINVIVPVVYTLTLLILSLFLYGFTFESLNGAAWMHPLLDLAMNGDRISLAHIITFIAISAALLTIAMVLYRRMKSEHAGNNVMFGGAQTITTVMVTFVGSCLAGGILQSLQTGNINALANHTMFFLGVAIASPVIFIITTMVVKGTIKIFSLKSLKRFGAFVVIMAIYCSFTTWDITGYTRRIPRASNVSSVSLPNEYLNMLPYAASYDWGSIRLRNRQSIQHVRALHQEIVERAKDPRYAALLESSDADGNGSSGTGYTAKECVNCFASTVQTINIEYALSNAARLSRSYSFYGRYLLNSPAYARLINDSGYRKATSIAQIGYSRIESASSSTAEGPDITIGAGHVNLNATDAQTLAKLMDEDYQSLPPTDPASLVVDYSSDGALKNKDLLLGVNFNLHTTNSTGYEPSSFYYGITRHYTRTIQWLKAKGLYNKAVTD